jgi:hypothetical protein
MSEAIGRGLSAPDAATRNAMRGASVKRNRTDDGELRHRTVEVEDGFHDRSHQRGFTGVPALLAAPKRPSPAVSTSTRTEPSAL